MEQREIKFRIWSDLLKTLYTPEMDEEIKNLWKIEALQGGVLKQQDGITVMQFTGLKDKNGKDIYEGDICELYGRPKKVIFWNGSFCFTSGDLIWHLHIHYKQAKVTGNIYQNPELI